MAEKTGVSLVEHFEDLEDPRIERTKFHQLSDIIVIAICAVICGADNWVETEEFGHAKRDWLEAMLGLPNGIPSHDTFGRVFARLDAEQFEVCFVRWVQHLHELTQGQLLAIDGKTVRRSHARRQKQGPLHLVSAWATTSRLVLGQTEVASDSNEITAIPELLEMLEISGCIVSIDAIGCQKAIAQQITESGGDYVLALKQNQPQLHEAVETMFTLERQNEFADVAHDFHQTIEKDHGRIETRRFGLSLTPNSSPTWTLTRSGHNCKAWSWSKPNDNCPKAVRMQLVTSSPACLPMPNCSCMPPAATGASRTLSTGSWMSPFVRTTVVSVKAMLSITWPSCAAWPSTSYTERKALKSVWLPNVNVPVGKLTISSKFSPNKMRMPWNTSLG